MRALAPAAVALVALSTAVACGGAETAERKPCYRAAAPEREEDARPGYAVDVYREVVQRVDRSAADRALDPGRRPAELLAFAGVRRGQRVAELGAGGGYTAELLARIVGPTGRVYAHNSPYVLERFAEEPWSRRLESKVMDRVVRLDRPFDDPFPDDVRGLDLVVIVLFYHDTFWQGVDRAAMNRAVYEALRPGGAYVIVDHSARPGRGAADVETLHRVEEPLVRREIEAAGFRLEGTADFLRNPSDPRDWNAAPSAAGDRRGSSDRFALRFVRPARD